MKDTIYLVVSRSRVERMTKNLPDIKRGEIPVRLAVEVKDNAFREPVISREVVVCDWRDGVDLGDIEFRESIITEDEAAIIRTRRLAKMREVLEAQGFIITGPDEVEGEADGG